MVTFLIKNKSDTDVIFSTELVYADILEKTNLYPNQKDEDAIRTIILNFFLNLKKQSGMVSNIYLRKSLRETESKLRRIIRFSDSYNQVYIPFHKETEKWIASSTLM